MMSGSTSKNSYTCFICDEQLGSQLSLKAHMLEVHQEEKSFQCKECLKRFPRKTDLVSHHLNMHAEKRFRCEECGKCFGRKSVLKQHLNSHLEEKPFRCEECSKEFASNGELKKHHRDNHAEKKFKCNQCDLAFRKEALLQQHLIVHQVRCPDARPFECPDCPERFRFKSSLTSHRLNCNAEKKFKCDQCEMAFGREAVLQQHLVIHSEEKPFRCTECPQGFAMKGSLTTHRLTVHAEKKFGAFKCDECGEGFERKVTLQIHLLQSHSKSIQRKTSGQRSLLSFLVPGQKSQKEPSERESANYSENQDDFDESDSVAGETNEDDNKRPKKMVKTQNALPDDEDLIGGIQKEVERERDSDCPPEEDSPTITFASDEEDLSEAISAKPSLKLGFDVEYRAPN